MNWLGICRNCGGIAIAAAEVAGPVQVEVHGGRQCADRCQLAFVSGRRAKSEGATNARIRRQRRIEAVRFPGDRGVLTRRRATRLGARFASRGSRDQAASQDLAGRHRLLGRCCAVVGLAGGEVVGGCGGRVHGGLSSISVVDLADLSFEPLSEEIIESATGFRAVDEAWNLRTSVTPGNGTI